MSVFGSAVTDRFRQDSDVDLIVEFAPLPPAEHARAYMGLLRELRELLGREVDLIEASAVQNPFVRSSIARTQQVLYAA